MGALGVLLAAVLATAVGHIGLIRLIPNWERASPPLQLGSAYFVGIALVIVGVTSLSHTPMGPRFASISVLVTIVGVLFLGRATLFRCCELIRCSLTIARVALVFLFCGLAASALLLFWLPAGTQGDPFAMVGTLHAPRYAGIANFIEQCGYIPRLSQNFGQSVLTYGVDTFFGLTPFIVLFAWLACSLIAFSTFIYGVIGLYVQNTTAQISGAAIVLLGNTAVSLSHVLVTDSGSPPLLSGYTDPLIGAFSAVMLIFIHQKVLQGPKRGLASVAILLVVVSCFSAPQTIVVLIGVLGTATVFHLVVHKRVIRGLTFWGAVLLSGLAIGLPQGGMLTPARWHSDVEIAGVMAVDTNPYTDQKQGVQFYPFMPFFLGYGSNRLMDTSAVEEVKEIMPTHNAPAIFWFLEQYVLTILRVVFFPLAGLALIYTLTRQRGPSTSENPHLLPLPALLGIGVLAVTVGMALAVPVSVNGYKWELVRFLIPGFTLGMLALGIGVAKLMASPPHPRLPLALSFLTIVIICGPTTGLIGTAIFNLNSARAEPLVSRWNTFTGSGPQFTPGSCRPFPEPRVSS